MIRDIVLKLFNVLIHTIVKAYYLQYIFTRRTLIGQNMRNTNCSYMAFPLCGFIEKLHTTLFKLQESILMKITALIRLSTRVYDVIIHTILIIYLTGLSPICITVCSLCHIQYVRKGSPLCDFLNDQSIDPVNSLGCFHRKFTAHKFNSLKYISKLL